MSGSRFLLDTNVVIRLLSDGVPEVQDRLKAAQWIGASVITKLEFLCYPGLTSAQRQTFEAFCAEIEICALTGNSSLLTKAVIDYRGSGLKLPDAIIAGTAQVQNAILLTGDREFLKISRGIPIQLV